MSYKFFQLKKDGTKGDTFRFVGSKSIEVVFDKNTIKSQRTGTIKIARVGASGGEVKTVNITQAAQGNLLQFNNDLTATRTTSSQFGSTTDPLDNFSQVVEVTFYSNIQYPQFEFVTDSQGRNTCDTNGSYVDNEGNSYPQASIANSRVSVYKATESPTVFSSTPAASSTLDQYSKTQSDLAASGCEFAWYKAVFPVTLPANSTTNVLARTLKIYNYAGSREDYLTVNIYQGNSDATVSSVSPTSLSVSAAGETKTVSVSSNTSWDATAEGNEV